MNEKYIAAKERIAAKRAGQRGRPNAPANACRRGSARSIIFPC